MNPLINKLGWLLFSLTGAFALGVIALHHGEPIGAIWILATCVLFKMKQDRFAWITIIPAIWVIVCTLTAAWQKIFDANPRIGFLAHANQYKDAIEEGIVLAPAKSIEQMQQVIFNDYVNASLAGLFMAALISMLFFGIKTVLQARAISHATVKEAPFELLPVYAATEK